MSVTDRTHTHIRKQERYGYYGYVYILRVYTLRVGFSNVRVLLFGFNQRPLLYVPVGRPRFSSIIPQTSSPPWIFGIQLPNAPPLLFSQSPASSRTCRYNACVVSVEPFWNLWSGGRTAGQLMTCQVRRVGGIRATFSSQ